MKRMFTFAIIAMIASLTFAQVPMAQKKTASKKIEKVMSAKELTQKVNEAKEMRAAMAEKAAAAQTSSSSQLRKAQKNNVQLPSVKGTVINSVKLNTVRTVEAAGKSDNGPRRASVQEGNVTVTTDANGIIIDVAGVEAKMYTRATSGTAYYLSGQSMGMAEQSGRVTIVEDGNNVYIKDPITRYQPGSWVKGIKEGNIITVATKQPLAYNSNYQATISLRWGSITADGKIVAADETAEAFTFTVDGDILALQGTKSVTQGETTFFMGAFWDDDNSATGYGDAETILTYDPNYIPPSTELVVLPEGAAVEGWYANGVSVSSSAETPVKNQKINVAFVGNEVYAQLSTAFPTAWVKGTIDGTTITFAKEQYVGAYNGSVNCWMLGYDSASETLKDAVATYDATAKTISFVDEVLINGATDKVYYLEWYVDLVLSAEEAIFEEPIITDLTANLPYYNSFDTDTEQFEAAVYDANDDKSTFTFEEEGDGMAARYRYSTSNAADDYLVFPGLTLKAGVTYKVAVDAHSYRASYPERVEIVAGKEAKVSQFTTTVIAATEIAAKEYQTLANGEFTVPEDGVYYFAVHAVSDANQFYLYVDNFSVTENNPAAPATVADLAVVADATGAKEATISFTVPTATVGGDALTGDLNVVVKRGDVEIMNEAKAAGSAVSFKDVVEAPGMYTYSVVVTAGEYVSDVATVSAWVGVDIPLGVEDITIADKSGSIALAWSAPGTVGKNNGIVIVEDLTYNVYPVDMVEFWGMTIPMTDYENPYATGLTDTKATVEYDTNTGDYAFTYFSVTAQNEAGESEDGYAAIVIGAPIALPVFESVADGSLSYWWGTACDANNSTLKGGLYISDGISSDNDGSCFHFAAETRGYINLQSAKVALAGAVNPVVTFDYKADAAATLRVIVITPQGETELATLTSGTEFAPVTVSLKDYANEDWVRVILQGEFSAANNLYVDNIKIYNQLDNNLVAGKITATSRVDVGDDISIAVEVDNQGSIAAEAYSVELYCNDVKVQTINATGLASGAKTTIEFTEHTNIMTSSELVWKAIVVYAADEDNANNETATAKTTVVTPKFPSVEDLKAVQGATGVELTWSEPNLESEAIETVTDDFENYTPFARENVGDWTLVDEDGGLIGGVKDMQFGDIVPGEVAAAYFVMNTVEAGIDTDETFAAHSGKQYMVSTFLYSGEAYVADWMISPELDGSAQTISFWAKSYSSDYAETFKMLYSTTDKNIESFTEVAEVKDASSEWTMYTFDVPAGAKYFAIKNVSYDAFMLFVDDVTYSRAGGSWADLAIVGYNVYRDGEKINTEVVAEPGYMDATAEAGSHSYVVTVVYDRGESKISNVAKIDVSGIGTIAAKKANIAVANSEIVVTNAAGKAICICTADGKTIYNAAGSDLARIRVESGVYIVKVGNAVAKAVVK